MNTNLYYDDFMASKLAENLRKLMDETGLDQEALSYKAKVGQSTISRALRDIGDIRESTLDKLGRVFGKNAAELRGYVVNSQLHDNNSVITRNEPMTTEQIAKMYGITDLTIVVILEKILTLQSAQNQEEVWEQIKTRIDIILERSKQKTPTL